MTLLSQAEVTDLIRELSVPSLVCDAALSKDIQKCALILSDMSNHAMHAAVGKAKGTPMLYCHQSDGWGVSVCKNFWVELNGKQVRHQGKYICDSTHTAN